MFRSFLKSTTALAVLATGGIANSANAQDQDQDSVGIDQIIVTARKREESLQDIPIALTALSASDIQEGGLQGLEDISSQAAGFFFYNQGQNQAGRVNTQLRFRGFNSTQFSPSFDTGALFIDGIFVLNGGTSVSLMDIERVEVIKGPQAAYFGRNTFAGAVNLITKDPDLQEFHGKTDLQVDDRGSYDISALLEGPIVPGKVSASLSGRYYDKRGHYVASDGGRLGNEETNAINAKLLFTPSENFKIVLRGSYSKDDDGAPQGGYIRGNLNDSCTGLTFTTVAGEVASPINYICGITPDVNNAVPALPGTNIIDSNTFLPDNVAAAIAGAATPLDGIPDRSTIGLTRKTKRFSAHATYDIPDMASLDLVVGYNDQGLNLIRDFDQSAFDNAYSSDPQALEDQSIEFRITSEQDQALRWLVGVNYYEQDFTASNAGGNFVTNCVNFGGVDENGCTPGVMLNFGNTFGQADHTEVLGFFAAADYDITDQLTLTLEGRYQDDQLTKGVAGPEGVDPDAALTVNFKKFLPRAILRWIPNDTTTLYFSYARGTLPGDVNTEYFIADASERSQIESAIAGAQEFVPEENVTTFELGWKQSFAEGRAQLNAAVFYNEWSGIKGRSAATVRETCDASGRNAIGVTGCAFPGVMPGDQKSVLAPDGVTLLPFFNRRNVLVPGDATIKGFEIELNGQLTSNWTAGFNVAYQDSKFKDYIFNFVEAISGFADQRGNRTPRTPKWSANLTSTATFPLGAETNGFVRGDINYLGKQALAETNLAFLDEFYLVNLRAGIETEDFRLELFVKNLTDEDAYAAGARFSDTAFPTSFSNFFIQQGVNVTAQDRRTIGVRASAKF